MGGWGSGQRWSSKTTTENYRSVDVRYLQREGILAMRSERLLRWTRNGETTASIVLQPEPDRVTFIYRSRDNGGEWTPQEYPVMLERTPCHYGGERVWFRCPSRACGRRVAILYGGRIFACRQCYRLAYECQKESVSDRADRRGWKIRAQCKDDWGSLLDPLFKPKGMHERTFRRLERKYRQSCETSQWSFATHLGISVEELLRMSGSG
jgi:hypothetical protein